MILLLQSYTFAPQHLLKAIIYSRLQVHYYKINVLNSMWPVCRYGSGTLTKVFVDRVFQECLTYDGEMVGNYNYVHNTEN